MTEVRWLSDHEQETWRAYLLMTQLLDLTLDRQLQRDARMPHAYYAILVTLSENPRRSVRMSDLATALNYSPSRLSHAAARMETAGWIRREPDPLDRRGTHATLTDTGMAALVAAAPGHVQCVRDNLFDLLTAEQVDSLLDICRSVLRRLNMGRDSETGSPD